MIRAGLLSRRVTYQTPTKTRDALGDESETWTTVGTFWAQIRSPTGGEALNASQMKAVANVVIEMRYPGFVPSPIGRFLYGTKVLNISWASDDGERRRRLQVYCTEQVDPTPQST